MTGLEIYEMDWSLRFYFGSDKDYDPYRYNFKAGQRIRKTYEGRKDKYHFEKFARKVQSQDEAVRCFLDAYLAQKNLDAPWIGNIDPRGGFDLEARCDALGYQIGKDLKQLLAVGDEDQNGFIMRILTSVNGKVPPILDAWIRHKISAETVTCIDSITGFLEREAPKINDPLVMWSPKIKLLRKYKPFLRRWINILGVQQGLKSFVQHI
jgi:hypothetical protein